MEMIVDNPYTWASNAAAIVAVNANGLLTGGTTNGTAVITVTLKCNTSITQTISVQNFNTVPASDSRVVVFDSATGILLADVDVYLNGTKVTTVAGIAAFPGVDCATDGCDLHVLPVGFTYVTALGLGVNDILIPVAPNVDTSIAGGVKGHLDLDAIPEVLVQDVSFGLSLFAVPGNLSDLSFTSIFGEMVQTNIKIGQSIDEIYPLPSGMEGYLSGTPLKDGFQTQGIAGAGTLWGLGGYADLGELMELVTASLGGDIEIGPILVALMPLFENFYHGIMLGVEFDMIDKVVDIEDINGNQDFTDFVADYANFKDIGTDFGVSQKQTQSAEITFQDLPPMGDDTCADIVFTMVGAMEDGVGFIPLGLDLALDENAEEEFDCKIGETGNNKTTAVFAPQHSGVSGYDYYTLSLAFLADKLGSVSNDFDISGIISRSSSSPTAIAMPAYMDFMMDASYNDDEDLITFDMTASKVADASFHRVVFSKKDGYTDEQRFWHIYWPADEDGFDFNLPAAINLVTFDNRAYRYEDSSLVQAIALEAVTYDDLFGFNATNTDDMNGFINAFSMHALAGTSSGCGGCNGTGNESSTLMMLMLLLSFAILRHFKTKTVI